MKIHIQLLRQSESFRSVLRKDGWIVEEERVDTVCARHPQVGDEVAARSRLNQLGFLTCSSLRIRFQHPFQPPAKLV